MRRVCVQRLLAVVLLGAIAGCVDTRKASELEDSPR